MNVKILSKRVLALILHLVGHDKNAIVVLNVMVLSNVARLTHTPLHLMRFLIYANGLHHLFDFLFFQDLLELAVEIIGLRLRLFGLKSLVSLMVGLIFFFNLLHGDWGDRK